MISILLLLGSILNKVNVLFYVGATDVLPPPLSKEEEEYYLTMASDGDLFARDIRKFFSAIRFLLYLNSFVHVWVISFTPFPSPPTPP